MKKVDKAYKKHRAAQKQVSEILFLLKGIIRDAEDTNCNNDA
jgi:hypothetical protein